MTDPEPHPDSPPEDLPDTNPDRPPLEREDERSDLQQVVEARSDAVDRGEGGQEPDSMTAPGLPDGVGGTGGVTKNQDDDAQ